MAVGNGGTAIDLKEQRHELVVLSKERPIGTQSLIVIQEEMTDEKSSLMNALSDVTMTASGFMKIDESPEASETSAKLPAW